MSEPPPLMVRFDEFELDEGNARLMRREQVLELPPRAFAVLCELVRHPDQLVTKDALLDAVWGHRHVSESVLKSAISQLRAALDDDAKEPKFIETAARRGYRFISPIGSDLRAASAAGSDVDATASAPPAADRAPTAFPITGRAAALSRLQAAWERACAGQRQLCWLAGEAGVGKTTLVDHFANSLGSIAVARGQCVDQHGAAEPYLPVLEALASLARNDHALVALLHSVAPTWLLQLPWLCSEPEREALRRELAGTTHDRMLREWGELLDRYTQDRPLLLVTEDLQWSDHATVNLLNHAARRRGTARWMWLSTFRVAEVIAEDHPMRAVRHELRLHGLADELLVDPFSEQELASYVARRLDGPAWPDAFLQALHRHTDGLPLFVANVIDDLMARGLLPSGAMSGNAQLAFDALSVPANLAGVIERQINRLPVEQTAVLEVASICGVEFKATVVAQVLGRDADWVARQCDVLARREQWLAPMQIERGANGELEARGAFRHALVRHVFRERMGALARAQLHHRVAQALANAPVAGASPAEIATQFELGQDPGASLPYCAAAAAGALQQFAPTDALHLADRGLSLARRCRPGAAVQEAVATLHTLRGAAAAQVLGVTAEETLQSFEQAQLAIGRLPHHPLRSMALHGLGLGLFLRGDPLQARELAEHSLAEARQRRDPVLTVAACDLLGQIIKLEGPPGDAIAVLEQGIEAASPLDEQTPQSAFVLDPLVNMQAALAIPLLLSGHDQRAKTQSDLALARARALRQPMARMIATWLALLCEIRRGERDQVAALAAQLRDITDEGALAASDGPSEWFAGLAQSWSGDPSEGHARIERAYRHSAQAGLHHGASEVLGYAAEASILAGEWARAAQQADDALQLAMRLHEHRYRPQLLLLKRRVALAQGACREADEAGTEALSEARRQHSPWLELTALVDICEGPDPGSEAMQALRHVVANLREGSNAPLINRARAVLGCD